MRRLKLVLILCLFSAAANAQFISNNKKVADVYFQNNEYYAAAEYYKRALQISPDSAGFVLPYGFENKIKEEGPNQDDQEYATFQLAESLRLYKNYTDAEQWYNLAKDFKNPKYILASFWYAETLRANQRFPEAIAAFNDFLNKYRVNDSYAANAKIEIASCQFALYEFRYPRLFKMSRLQNNINNKGSNYTPTLNGDDFYFTSSRPVSSLGRKEVLSDRDKTTKVTKKESPYLNAVYEVSGSPLTESISVKRIGTGGKGKESAAPAFHPNGQVMYITSWTANGDKKIYRLNAVDGGKSWSEPAELGAQVNVKGFNAIQPFVSKDGKYLIFSSNRPGGIGKYDLWYCPLRTDGSVGQAINMGKSINTDEDDQAPYYNPKTEKLLYSSNGKVGMGGFDFYEVKGDFTTWTEPRNLGYPFNSSKDDIYFSSVDDLDTEGYISSDRESLCCLEVFHVKREYLSVRGVVFDCNTMKPLTNATILLVDSLEQFSITTDQSGAYHFKVSSNRKITITAEKDKYLSKVISFNYDDLAKKDTLFSPDICLIPYEIDKPIVLKDILYEFNSAELTPDSELQLDHLYTIMIDNPNIEIQLNAHTDSKGVDIYNLDLSNRRAKSCVDYLVSKGIPEERMTSMGYGEGVPIAPNEIKGKDNPEGRALNRRTEFKVTKK
ncbi:OmpA family protein [Pedobacter metabolipauper]|uniref:WD40 repeat protein n=1 Tax=Pedobacter metabolipauper TaxID=425513 RepID=A0A4R6SZZ9_9SPHI|nr:OmpA family protein [Pedobacter metabolipauper]TDQ10145.1 WD40 repeat protein [Pedobacter metabolipauper]